MAVIKIDKSLDIYNAEALLNKLNQACHHDEVILDCSAVSKVSTPCLQIILSFFSRCNEKSVPIAISNPSEALLSAINTLNISAYLKFETINGEGQ